MSAVVKTGEVIPAGAYTLSDCAAEASKLLGQNTKNNWRIGELLSIARGLCETADCGSATVVKR